jgi:hypothetical protein
MTGGVFEAGRGYYQVDSEKQIKDFLGLGFETVINYISNFNQKTDLHLFFCLLIKDSIISGQNFFMICAKLSLNAQYVLTLYPLLSELVLFENSSGVVTLEYIASINSSLFEVDYRLGIIQDMIEFRRNCGHNIETVYLAKES